VDISDTIRTRWSRQDLTVMIELVMTRADDIIGTHRVGAIDETSL